jgi:hypothetical protein
VTLHTEERTVTEPDARERELVDLVRFDYDVTLRTITGVLATATGLRLAGFTAWGALLGLGLRDDSWALCASAGLVLLLFAYADAHHALLYRNAVRRAVRLEQVLDRYVDRLGIDAEDEDAVLEVRAELEMHRFGMYRTMPRSTKSDLLTARPRPVFAALYPSLLATALGTTLIVGL